MATLEETLTDGAAPTKPAKPAVRRPTRPAVVHRNGALAPALGVLELVRRLSWVPERPAPPDGPPPDIQFDLDRYIPSPAVVDGVPVRFPPVHTVFVTAALSGTPSARDQRVLADALHTLEHTHPLFCHVGYGLPYFRRLPAGLVALYMPRLLPDSNRFVLEEAVPSPSDTAVRVEHNDILFTLRGDDPAALADALTWLAGGDLLAGARTPSPRLDAGLRLTSARAMFVQMGLPRKIAANRRLPYASMIHPRSPMWMGFADQHAEHGASPRTVTFQGSPGIRLTTASAGDYFDNGAIQHLSHDVLDLHRFYDEAAFTERIQRMFRHASTLRRTARTADGRPLHQRVDGPGFDGMDVPGGPPAPKLQFSVFVPTADLFARMRRDQAVADGDRDAGLDRFITATRRQNFLVPPRRHRAFPLLELA
jgi:hypothetical protein